MKWRNDDPREAMLDQLRHIVVCNPSGEAWHATVNTRDDADAWSVRVGGSLSHLLDADDTWPPHLFWVLAPVLP